MTAVRILLTFIILPYLVGRSVLAGWAVCAIKKRGQSGTYRFYPMSFKECLEALLIGTTAEWMLFEVMAVPLILAEQPFSILLGLWSCAMAVSIAVGIVLTIYLEKSQSVPGYVNNKQNGSGRGKALNRWGVVLLICVLLLIGFQCYSYYFGMHIDWDDSRFIAHAVETFTHGKMLTINPATGEYAGLHDKEVYKDIIAPWPVFLALLARLTGIHPTILAHTVLPPVYLFFTYGVYYLIGKQLFRQDTNRSLLFTGIIAFVMLFFDAATRSQAEFILVRMWQGKTVLAAIGIPLVFLVFLVAAEKGTGILWELLPLSAACCMLSAMAIPVLGFCITGGAACYILFTKKWRAVVPVLLGLGPLLVLALLDLRIR